MPLHIQSSGHRGFWTVFENICGENGLADNRNCVSLKKRVAFIHQIRLMDDQIRWPEFLPILPTRFPPGTLHYHTVKMGQDNSNALTTAGGSRLGVRIFGLNMYSLQADLTVCKYNRISVPPQCWPCCLWEAVETATLIIFGHFIVHMRAWLRVSGLNSKKDWWHQNKKFVCPKMSNEML